MRIDIYDGLRIPFQPSGTVYRKLMAYDMLNACFTGLLSRNSSSLKDYIDLVNVGTVMQEVKTSNIARESAIKCGIRSSVPAETVTQACISSSRALCSSAETIVSGNASLALVGGVETFSDLPIRHSRKMRDYLLTLPKEMKKGVIAGLKHTSNLKIKDFSPELPAIANFTTGEVMRATSEKISKRYNISREEQDKFTLRSHELALQAHLNGFYKDEIIEFMGTKIENNIRKEITLENLSKLRPSFVKKDGTHTAGNSSGLTDGATCCLIGKEQLQNTLGLKPIGYLKSWVFTGTDPYKEMLLGPAYAIPKLLAKNGITLDDIDVFEIHEAFAGQILANIKALKHNNVGIMPENKLNLWGGSLAIGHPLGASNIRNVITACNRLKIEGGRYALVSACADGGLASAILIESPEN